MRGFKVPIRAKGRGLVWRLVPVLIVVFLVLCHPSEMMPDVLLWLGLKRIDWYFSMSLEKYEAIAGMGVSVMQRIDLPDTWVPKGATVEITAKVAAGYHKDTLESISERLRQPEGIREQCGKIFALAQAGKGSHFTVDMSKVPETVQFVVDTIHKNYPTLKIPHHSRLRHFEAGGVDRVAALVRSRGLLFFSPSVLFFCLLLFFFFSSPVCLVIVILFRFADGSPLVCHFFVLRFFAPGGAMEVRRLGKGASGLGPDHRFCPLGRRRRPGMALHGRRWSDVWPLGRPGHRLV